MRACSPHATRKRVGLFHDGRRRDQRHIATTTTTTTTTTRIGNWQLVRSFCFLCLFVCIVSFNVALANSGVDSATISARGHTNGAVAWPSRRNGCRPSSICTACTKGRDAPYRTPFDTSSSRRVFVAATTASCRWTLSANPCSAGTPGTAAATALCASLGFPVDKN